MALRARHHPEERTDGKWWALGWLVAGGLTVAALLGCFLMAYDFFSYHPLERSELLAAGTVPFSSVAWRDDQDARTGARASMIATVLRDHLPAVTTRRQVVALFGPPDYTLPTAEIKRTLTSAPPDDWVYYITQCDEIYNFWVLRFRFDHFGHVIEKSIEFSGT